MAKLFVMDHTGHTTVDFDKADPAQVKDAQALFEKLLNEDKHIAATRKAGETDYQIAKTFDQLQDETLLRPQMQGG